MAEQDVINKLNGVFQDVFSDDSLQVSRATTAHDVEGWDSLMHINLIVAIEREFKVHFTTREIAGLQNVGELLDLIRKKGASS